jgi:hypothetical protein
MKLNTKLQLAMKLRYSFGPEIVLLSEDLSISFVSKVNSENILARLNLTETYLFTKKLRRSVGPAFKISFGGENFMTERNIHFHSGGDFDLSPGSVYELFNALVQCITCALVIDLPSFQFSCKLNLFSNFLVKRGVAPAFNCLKQFQKGHIDDIFKQFLSDIKCSEEETTVQVLKFFYFHIHSLKSLLNLQLLILKNSVSTGL